MSDSRTPCLKKRYTPLSPLELTPPRIMTRRKESTATPSRMFRDPEQLPPPQKAGLCTARTGAVGLSAPTLVGIPQVRGCSFSRPQGGGVLTGRAYRSISNPLPFSWLFSTASIALSFASTWLMTLGSFSRESVNTARLSLARVTATYQAS